MKPRGLIIYEGPSLINGEPIVSIANCFSKSENRKTGKDMIQTWILPRFVVPTVARKTRADKSVCGDCRHREWSTCYVNLGHGPYQVWHTYIRKVSGLSTSYQYLQTKHMKMFKGKVLRIGSYGDPAAVPHDIWKLVAKASKNTVGYTHQWKSCDKRLAEFCMASVESQAEAWHAKYRGWRTFRTILKNDPLLGDEYRCPAAEESGHKTTCDKCMGCSGKSKAINNPVIIAHGRSSQRYAAIIEAIRRHKKRSHLMVPGNFRAKRKVKKV